MSECPQNILREAADRLIQTAEHLGRVASLASANSAASSLSETRSVVAAASRAMRSIPPQTVHHRSLRPLLQSVQGYLDTGLQLHAMSEAVVPVPEVEVEVEQTLAPRTISTSEASLGADRLFAWLTATKHIHRRQTNGLC